MERIANITKNRLILAPMVRIGTTPFRLLCLKYGADLVFTEEIIAKKLMHCERVFNEDLGMNEYISSKDGTLVLRIHPDEKGKLILQIGASDPEDAVKATSVVKDDIVGVDVNMGCPKHFSTHGNMGSRLLHLPDLAKDILENLVSRSGLPVSCKIRLLEDKNKTKEFIEMVQSTGIKFFTVHLRLKDQPPKFKANWKALVEIKKIAKIPFNANGDILSPFDIYYLKQHDICDGFMLARGAIHYPKIFEDYKNLSDDQFVLNSHYDGTDKLENDYEEIIDVDNDESNNKSKKHNKKDRNEEDDLKVSNKLSKIFDKKYYSSPVDILPCVQDYIELAMQTGNNFSNAKYNTLYILKTHKNHLDLFKKIQSSKDYKTVCDLLHISNKYEDCLKTLSNITTYWDSSFYKERFRNKTKQENKNNII